MRNCLARLFQGLFKIALILGFLWLLVYGAQHWDLGRLPLWMVCLGGPLAGLATWYLLGFLNNRSSYQDNVRPGPPEEDEDIDPEIEEIMRHLHR